MSVSMTTLKSEFAAFFARDLKSDYAALSDKNAARENLANTLAGCALQWAHSGNDAHIQFEKTLPTKGANAARCRAAIKMIAGKPRHLHNGSLEDFSNYGYEVYSQICVALTPAPKAAPAPKAPIIKAPAPADILTAIAAGLYSAEDIAAITAALQTAPAIKAPAPALM
jgi:hypothetical protein